MNSKEKKYEYFCKALENLEVGVRRNPPYSIVEQVGILRLFEICFDQSWRVMKAILENRGKLEENLESPRKIIKLACQCGMLHDYEAWMDILEVKKIIAHDYDDKQVLSIIEKLKSDYWNLFLELKVELDEKWL